MEKFKIITLLLCLVFVGENIQSQQNNHHGVLDANLAQYGDVETAAYDISELDMGGIPNNDVTFISAFTSEDRGAGKTWLHFRRTKACLDSHENYYEVADIPYITPPTGSYRGFSVNDLKEVRGTGNYEVVICGTFVEKEAYVTMYDRNFNPMTNFNTYYGLAHTFHSIAEVPGMGFLVCGEGYYPNNGVIIALDYGLRPISCYSSRDHKFTDIVYNAEYNLAYVAGYFDIELCVYGLDVGSMYAGSSNPVIAEFAYTDPNFVIKWNASGKDNIKITEHSPKITIAASGEDPNGRNIGIFYEHDMFANISGPNIVFDLGRNTYFKGLVRFGDRYNLLLQEDAGAFHYPHIVDMYIFNNFWEVVRINGPVKSPMKMLKRANCEMLDILSIFNASTIFYSSCHSTNFRNLSYHPIESYIMLPVNHLPPQVSQAPPLSHITAFHNRNFFPTQNPRRSYIISSISFMGDCFPSCLRKVQTEYEELSVEELVKDENSVIIYNNSIEISDISDYSQYQIFDIMGRQINNDKIDKNTISIQAIPNGTYFLRLTKTNGETEHHKFMRQ
ncbi:MAG: T9SS type A sorting domain-containing protein [Bacteroidales bacterium]|jgi:hypothetical protein|nr:T9SS type A sorting domain-containing protein [Bacteroidales bacterium]